MPPSPTDFRQYYVDGLEEAIKTETKLYFQHVLDRNLPIDMFLDADFTFVNGALARLYGIEGIQGTEFQQVALEDRRRGGLPHRKDADLRIRSNPRTDRPTDRPAVDDLVAQLDQQGNGLRDLVLLIVQSDTFRTK